MPSIFLYFNILLIIITLVLFPVALARNWYIPCKKQMMMNQYEVAHEIATVMPDASKEIAAAMNLKNPFVIVKLFTRHIQKLVEVHNEAMVERCLKVMDKIYDRGDALLRNAVENIFIFSFDSVLSGCDRAERRTIYGIMPMGLYTVYINQIYKSGI